MALMLIITDDGVDAMKAMANDGIGVGGVSRSLKIKISKLLKQPIYLQ